MRQRARDSAIRRLFARPAQAPGLLAAAHAARSARDGPHSKVIAGCDRHAEAVGAWHVACAWAFEARTLGQASRGTMRNRKLEIETFAKINRSNPTPSEAALWRLLKNRQTGTWFKRQVPLGGMFVADFVAPAKRLVVEVDGASHRGRSRADQRRDRKLRKLGYRVLRLSADLVLQSPEETVRLIRTALAAS